MTELSMFIAFIRDRFGFTHCDMGYTRDGTTGVSFADEKTYTFFYFNEEESFDRCLSRRYSDRAEIETPGPMLRLCDDFKERLQEKK